MSGGKTCWSASPRCGQAYNNLAVAYYYRRDYTNAWKVIEAARRKTLEEAINLRFIEALKKVSGRNPQN